MRTGLVTMAAAMLIAGVAFAAHAQGVDKPLLLVASPATSGFYSRSVLIVVPNGDQHVGFMINRATRTTVAAAFPDEPHSARVAEPIYLGGPSGAQSLYAVARAGSGEGSRRLFGELFLLVGSQSVDRIIRESPREARYFAGFTVWSAGELAAEIGHGRWLTAEPEEALLFHPNPDAMWPGLVERIRGTR